MKKTSHFRYKDQSKLNQLTNIVVENIEDLYEYFEAEYHKGQKVYFSNCFIHGGDNKSALNLYYDADYRVHFKCRTHGCEKHFGTSLLSMIRGGLSNVKYGWKNPGDKTVSFNETIDFLLNKYKIDFGQIKGESLNVGNHEFCKIVNALSKNKLSGTIDREFYRKRVEIPSQYFLNRGYTIEVLDDYDVGNCKTYGKEFFNRAVVPIYDDDGDMIVGFTARSIFNQCKECKSYHDPNKQCYHFPKWRHSKGFQKEKSLYNFWKAKDHILESGVIVLVESPGNVWRLEEAGIHNSVALFGTVLNAPQKQLIDESGALSVIIIMDNDENEAGQKAAKKIKEQCEKSYRVYTLDINKQDVGEMNTNEITEDIRPWINKAKEIYK